MGWGWGRTHREGDEGTSHLSDGHVGGVGGGGHALDALGVPPATAGQAGTAAVHLRRGARSGWGPLGTWGHVTHGDMAPKRARHLWGPTSQWIFSQGSVWHWGRLQAMGTCHPWEHITHGDHQPMDFSQGRPWPWGRPQATRTRHPWGRVTHGDPQAHGTSSMSEPGPGGDLRPWGHVTHGDTSPMGTCHPWEPPAHGPAPRAEPGPGGDLRPQGHITHGVTSPMGIHLPIGHLPRQILVTGTTLGHRDTGRHVTHGHLTVHRSPVQGQLGRHQPWGCVTHGVPLAHGSPSKAKTDHGADFRPQGLLSGHLWCHRVPEPTRPPWKSPPLGPPIPHPLAALDVDEGQVLHGEDDLIGSLHQLGLLDAAPAGRGHGSC